HGCGIDISSTAVQLARNANQNDEKLYFRIADGRDIPFEKESFEVVLSWGVIEHSVEYHRALGEAYRVLAKGGCLILIQPHLLSFAVIQKHILRLFGKWKFGTQYEFSYTKLKSMLKTHGF